MAKICRRYLTATLKWKSKLSRPEDAAPVPVRLDDQVGEPAAGLRHLGQLLGVVAGVVLEHGLIQLGPGARDNAIAAVVRGHDRAVDLVGNKSMEAAATCMNTLTSNGLRRTRML